ncbi:hypothetical protein QE152_g36850 [Popillia japonica]|uniref:PiggyBac transposable element-derived protein domain-containing protein n=1 Tax=Popillia japonica TaxID=7064 RepID=A0AAW1IBD3_POPJA
MTKNKREMPELFTQRSGRPIRLSMFGFGYIPKEDKNILLFSTMHKGDDVNGVTGKPEIIHAYNETKGGVGMVNILCAQYNIVRGTKRWVMVVSFLIQAIPRRHAEEENF